MYKVTTFYHLQENLDKYGKKLMDTATKTGIDAAKTVSKRVVQRTAEATGDLIENKIDDKITSVGKPKNKVKENEINEIEEVYVPPEVYNRHHIKMEYQKIANLLGNVPDKVPKFITTKWVEVYDQSGNAGNRYKPSKQMRFKTPVLKSDLCGYSDSYIVAKGTITIA